MESTTSQISNKEELQAAGKHLEGDYAAAIKNSVVQEKQIVTWNLDELRSGVLIYSHTFKLTNGTRICPELRTIPKKWIRS